MGCTPTESFLVSTLECFYNVSCINLIQDYVNLKNGTNMNVTPTLFANSSRFPSNKLIIDLVKDLFVESWSSNNNYSAYFTLCLPTSCSYTYVQQLNSLYTVTVILGLYGGLNVVMQGICRILIYLLFKVHQYKKKRSSVVDAEHCMEVATIESANTALPATNVANVSVDLQSVPTLPTLQYVP